MGRGIRHSKNKGRQATRERPPQDRGQGSGYKDIVRDNPLFDAFYRAQVNVLNSFRQINCNGNI